MAVRGRVVFKLTFVTSDEVVTVQDRNIWSRSILLRQWLHEQAPNWHLSTEDVVINPPPSSLNARDVRFLFAHLGLDYFNAHHPDFNKETNESLRKIAQAAEFYGCIRFIRNLDGMMNL